MRLTGVSFEDAAKMAVEEVTEVLLKGSLVGTGEGLFRLAKFLTRKIKGVMGELAGRKAMEDLGYRSLPCKLKGNRGFDGVYVKYKEGSEEVVEIVILESKFSSRGTVRLSHSGKGTQMDDDWIDNTLKEMSRSDNPDLIRTAELISGNSEKVRRKLNVLGPDGANVWHGSEKLPKSNTYE